MKNWKKLSKIILESCYFKTEVIFVFRPLEHVCAALREDLDLQHKKRMEALETKMKPIIVKDGPSKKVNFAQTFC